MRAILEIEASMTATETYRASPIRRNRRTKAEIEGIKSDIFKIVKAGRPMTVRQVFYQLVVGGVVEKTEEQYQGTVIRLLTEMRLARELPFHWITDESRRRRITRTYDSVSEAMEATAKFYRRSALRECSDYIEIWCEKDALAGVLWDVTSDYDVPLMVSRGMPSLTFLHGTAEAIRAAASHGKNAYIYQFGDHDPSGVLIPKTIMSRLIDMGISEGLIIERVALTEDQITEFNLPTRPTKRDGNRHANGFEGDSVELDALPPDVLRGMVRDVIERHITPRALETLRAAEES